MQSQKENQAFLDSGKFYKHFVTRFYDSTFLKHIVALSFSHLLTFTEFVSVFLFLSKTFAVGCKACNMVSRDITQLHCVKNILASFILFCYIWLDSCRSLAL